jgi:hypothetical protein
MAKPSPPPSVETSYTETAAQLTSQLASISNDPLISRAPADELFAMDPPDPNPSSFDSISEKITDEIIERAIFKPSTGSSAGADGIHCLPLSRHPPPQHHILPRPRPFFIVLEARCYASTAQAQFSRLSPHLSSEASGQENRAPTYVASERRYPTTPQPTWLSIRNLCNRCC